MDLPLLNFVIVHLKVGIFLLIAELPVEHVPSCGEPKESEVMSTLLDTEFTSPIQATPMFKTFAEAIPSPIFSESVSYFRNLNFLLHCHLPQVALRFLSCR